MEQWDFYVLSKEELKKVSGDKSSISLSLLNKSDYVPVGFNDLKNVIK